MRRGTGNANSAQSAAHCPGGMHDRLNSFTSSELRASLPPPALASSGPAQRCSSTAPIPSRSGPRRPSPPWGCPYRRRARCEKSPLGSAARPLPPRGEREEEGRGREPLTGAGRREERVRPYLRRARPCLAPRGCRSPPPSAAGSAVKIATGGGGGERREPGPAPAGRAAARPGRRDGRAPAARQRAAEATGSSGSIFAALLRLCVTAQKTHLRRAAVTSAGGYGVHRS